MQRKSFLCALSGSRHSQFAFFMAIYLAETIDAGLTVQHVVDSDSAWELFGHDIPGLIGNAPYIAAYESLRKSLWYLGKRLAGEAHPQLRKSVIESHVTIDEGNPVAEICLRAASHDLLIIGHQPTNEETRQNGRSQFSRTSIAEAVAMHCSKPTLFVQSEFSKLSSIKIVATPQVVCADYITGSLHLADLLSLQSEVVFVNGDVGADEDESAESLQFFKELNPILKSVPLRVVSAESEILEATDADSMAAFAKYSETLVVTPTKLMSGRRHVVLGTQADVFVRDCALPYVLLWPEDQGWEAPDVVSNGNVITTSNEYLEGRIK